MQLHELQAKAFKDVSNGRSLGIADFNVGRTIGKGRYARVRLASLKSGEHRDLPICLKVLKKTDIIAKEQVEHIRNEKNVLTSLSHPYFIRILKVFQDVSRLYMVLELVNGGELFTVLRTEKRFKLDTARFYAAEIVSAIQCLHEMMVVYRDIKPENILIHRSGHIKLTDFGFAKILQEGKTHTTCGTASYMAPEIIRGKGHGLPVDWWATGVLIFEMLAGQPPFNAPEDSEIYKQVVMGRVRFPPVMNAAAKDCISRMLLADPRRRLGNPEAPGITIRQHEFFASIDWEACDAGRMTPPWIPEIADDLVDSQFERFEESSCGDVAPIFVEGKDPFVGWEEQELCREEVLKLAADFKKRQQEAIEKIRLEEERAKIEQERLHAEELRLAEEKKAQAEKQKQEEQAKAKEESEKQRLADRGTTQPSSDLKTHEKAKCTCSGCVMQ
eukprot:gnl/TRDRNA2_/TRDRNA2_193956_c0_seq1.p1 gnl/TRDRNA2_/TRDRNA2_193956_c0~~gnl/TRDRNA2_/TRDRNA2_193956_c0_seq1.p1  ORF type:complete len:481 (-),score=130.15 gnl/TRDRNA2_/TRDRNA2_193956_c0_seq1:103-1434(-)